MTECIRYDAIQIKAVVTPDGFIRDRPVITRTGIFEYRDSAGKTVREYRSPDEVFKADSLATVLGIPITDKHHGMITADNVSAIIGTVLTPGVKEDAGVVADIVIHQAKRLGSKRELSLGYHAEVVTESGVTPDGHRYDAVQRNIRYNHLAVVERGRAGNARLRLDSNEAVSFDMEDDVTDPVRLVSVRLDNGIEYQASPEVAQAIHKLGDDLKTKSTSLDRVQAELDSLKAQNTEVETTLAEVLDAADATRVKGKTIDAAKLVTAAIKDMPARLRARSELEETAKKHEIKFDSKTTDRAIREAVVTKVRGDAVKFDDKSDDYVASAYDFAIANDTTKTKKVAEQRVAVTKTDSKTEEQPTGGASAARSRMLNGLRNRQVNA